MVDESESANTNSESAPAKAPKSSKHLIIICAAVIGITGLCLWANATKQSETPRVMAGELDGVVRTQKEKVVYAIQDIPEGSEITADALEEKEIASSRVPQGALTSASLAVGRCAGYGIFQGQIVNRNDLQSVHTRAKVTEILRTTIKIPKGTRINQYALKLERIGEGQPPRAALVKLEDIVGRVAKRDIGAKQLIFEEYLVSKDATNLGTKAKKK